MSAFFGGSSFGTTNATQQNSGGMFGTPSSQPQQQPGTNLFGGGQKSFSFGGLAATSSSGGGGLFGNPGGNTASSVFGNGTTTQPATTGGFFGGGTPNATGGTMGLFQTQTQQPTGTTARFDPEKATDTINKNGTATTIQVKFQCYSVMKQFGGDKEKSLEELRLEDYQAGRKGKQPSAFLSGGSGFFGGSSTPTAASSPVPPSQPVGGFLSAFGTASPTAAPTPPTASFGGNNSLFGQPATPQNTGTGGTFGNLFGQNQQQQNKPGGFFGATATTQAPSVFGTTPGTPFNFGTTSSTPPQPTLFSTATATPPKNLFGATTPQTNIFGQPQQPTAPAPSAFGSFGSPQPANSGVSPFAPQQPTQSGASFWNQPATSAGTTSSIFGTNTTATTTTTPRLFSSSPAFGTTTATSTAAPAFNTSGSIFGGNGLQQQNKPAFSFPSFSSTTQPTKPTLTFPSFTTPATTTAVSTGLPAFNWNSSPQQQQQSGPFGGNKVAGTFSNQNWIRPVAPGFTFNAGQIQQQPLQVPQQMQALNPALYGPVGPISFGTSPFKDNKLYYNLDCKWQVPKARKYDEFPTPTRGILHPSCKKMRRPSSGTGSLSPYNISAFAAVKNLTHVSRSKTSCLTKYKIFDGFEDDDFGVGVDILSPKTDVKKLNLHSLVGPFKDISLSKKGSPPISSTPSRPLALRSTQILRQRQIEQNETGATLIETEIKTLFRNRRVRFTLPSSVSTNDDLPSPILSPVQVEADLNFGDSRESYSEVFPDDTAGRGQRDVENRPPFSPGMKCGVVSTRVGYYLKPGLEELDGMVDNQGNCVVIGLEIGRKNFGKIKFLCAVNMRDINVDKLVQIRHKEIIVYPDDKNKPDLGSGLNVPAEIHLERVWPLDKVTNELVRDPEDEKWQNYENKLQRACKRMKAEFVSYIAEDGVWIFRVGHF